MTWSVFARLSHRWLSIGFVAIVAAIFVMLGTGNQPAQWIYYLPLVPLAPMILTGVYMFFRPYVAKGRA